MSHAFMLLLETSWLLLQSVLLYLRAQVTRQITTEREGIGPFIEINLVLGSSCSKLMALSRQHDFGSTLFQNWLVFTIKD